MSNLGVAVKQDSTIASNIVIAPGETAMFSLDYEFIEIGSPQDYDRGQNYSATIEIQIVSAS